jgi:hypothetical protein
MYPRLSNSTLSQLAAALLLVTCSLLPEDARAQEVDPDYTLTAQNATVLLGQTSEIVVTLDSAGDPIQGWSFGLCHDDTVLDFVGSEYGHTLNTVKNGNPADFVDISVQDGGWTTGVIVCLSSRGADTSSMSPPTRMPLATRARPMSASATTSAARSWRAS